MQRKLASKRNFLNDLTITLVLTEEKSLKMGNKNVKINKTVKKKVIYITLHLIINKN